MAHKVNWLGKRFRKKLTPYSHANMIEFGEPSEMFDAKNIPKGVDRRNKAWGHVIPYLYSPYI